MLKTFIVFFILLFLCPFAITAQGLKQNGTLNVQAPTNASIKSYDQQVISQTDLARGVYNLTVPLFSQKVEGRPLDVTLSYETSGVPVFATPSVIGLGWRLNVGGYITRKVNGYADDRQGNGIYGYMYSDGSKYRNPNVEYFKQYFQHITNEGVWNTVTDDFSYNDGVMAYINPYYRYFLTDPQPDRFTLNCMGV
jgi:hypothetical protein